jgi:CheY-like chemotaxis protein
MEVDPAARPEPGTVWACPSCRAPLDLSAAVEPAPARPAAPTAGSPLAPEAEAWVKGQLDALRAELLAEVRRNPSAAPSGAPAAAAGGDPSGLRVAGAPSWFGNAALGRAALVVEEDQAFAAAACQALQELGFQPEVAQDLRVGLRRLNQVEHAIVLVNQVLAGDAQAGFKILDWISKLPGPRRRRMFVACVSSDVQTMDTGSAFICGANLTVNKADAPRLAEILRQGLAERDQLYRTFLEVMDAVQG